MHGTAVDLQEQMAPRDPPRCMVQVIMQPSYTDSLVCHLYLCGFNGDAIDRDIVKLAAKETIGDTTFEGSNCLHMWHGLLVSDTPTCRALNMPGTAIA